MVRVPPFCDQVHFLLTPLDPHWANPIKNRIRQKNQTRAVNEVVNALKPSQSSKIGDSALSPLRVINGTSINTSSTLTTAARENVTLSSSPHVEGLPGRPGNSTIRWGGGLRSYPEAVENEEHDSLSQNTLIPELPPPRREITPSLATLEKAVSARIYFENLYFPLFRHPPSREQRRLAMEKDMLEMRLNHMQKENLRARWRQNETDYLRERRRKLDASAFIKLKTIGHGGDLVMARRGVLILTRISFISGAFGVVSLVREQSSGNLYAMKQVRSMKSCPQVALRCHPHSCERRTCYVKVKRDMCAPSVISLNRPPW